MAHHRMPGRIGKYEVEAEISHTSLGRVYRAFDRDTGRAVSLELLTEVNGRPLAERFRREVAMAARLRCASMVAVYELGEHLGLPFAAMEYLGEHTLRRAMDERRPVTVLQKMLVMWQVAEGLQAAHAAGLAYVGLRPSGIALSAGGRATIRDFGIVRLAGEEPDYLSPEEHTSGFVPDSLCDIFAFGAIYHEFLGEDECPQALHDVVRRARDQRRELRCQSLEEIQYEAEPVLRSLKRQRAAELLDEARRLKDAGEAEKARGAVREALELDPDNRDAVRFHREIREALQRDTVRPRVEALWREADQEAGARRFKRAVELLTSALHLDSASAEARSRLDRMCGRLEQSRHTAQLVAEARQLLERQALNEAAAKASEALERDPEDPGAAEVLQALKIEQEVAKAKSCLLVEAFDEALAILHALRNQYPGSPGVEQWLAHVESQKAEAERAAGAVRPVLEEAQWLLEQDRPDLAAQFLEEKSAAFPNHPELVARLAAVQDLLPAWKKDRFVQDALHRAAALEQLQQWSGALTVIEEAIETAPGAAELLAAAERCRVRLRDQERRKKVTRLAAEVRQCLADGDTAQAEEILRKGEETAGDEPVLRELRQKLEADKTYRDGWRAAQVLFGRRQFQEAERLLVALQAPDRPEVDALLETVRNARAASEEQDFYNQGREKALKLIEQRQFEQAADLLRNLLSLFPGDAILERDLQTAQAREGGEPAAALQAVAEPVPSDPPPPPALAAPAYRAITLARVGWAVAGAVAVLLVISGSAAIWSVSRDGSPGRRPVPGHAATAPLAQMAVEPEKPAPFPPSESPVPALKPQPQAKPARPAVAPKLFLLSQATKPAAAPLMAPPPGAAPVAGAPEAPALGAPAPNPVPPVSAPAPAPGGGNLVEAKCSSCPPPVMPPVARQLSLYGTVTLETLVDRRGAVAKVTVVSGHPILAQAARTAVAGWRYQPATLNGTAIERKTFIRVEFKPN